MKTVFGTIMVGGLVLSVCSPSHAQVNVQFGRGGSPRVSVGQPVYAQNPYSMGQPVYGQAYGQPAYYPQASYAQPYAQPYYSSGYSGYSAPRYPQGYYQPGYAGPAYQAPYRPTYSNGYSPYPQPAYGTGLMINGRMYTLPR